MKKIFIVTAIIAGCVGLFATYQLYQNSKTDGFNRGSIEVDRCQEQNAEWKIYKCTGMYTSGAGMISKDNVSITVTGGEPQKGDFIYDVYPPMFRSKIDTDRFVTGKERSSVFYNSPWLLLLFISIFAPLGVLLYTLEGRRKNSNMINS